MERYASIDIGSNTVKLLIAEQAADGSFSAVLDMALPVRLGEGIHDRRLREAAMRRTLEALEEFVTRCQAHDVTKIAAVGTSALRDAINRDEFLTRAAGIGIPAEAISGDEEARLSFLAVSSDPNWISCGPLLVVDIGGGSTEVIFGNSRVVEFHTSIRLGAVRLTEACLRSDPPTVAEVEEACNRARTALEGVSQPPAICSAVGVGGTLTTMSAIHLSLSRPSADLLHGDVLNLDEIDSQVEQFAERSVEERKQIVGLNPARADIILGGAIILREALSRFGKDSISVSCRGLRWGVLFDRFGQIPREGS